jgi:MFS family permease
VWGNFGLAFAALVTGALIDLWHWRAAFILPGLLSIALGAYFWRLWPAHDRDGAARAKARAEAQARDGAARGRPDGHMWRVFLVLAVAAALNSLIFNATTISMPKVFDERLHALTQTALGVGVFVCLTYCLAAMAQLLVGALIDRFPLRSIFVPIVALQVPLLFLASRLENAALLVVAVAMMFSVFGQIPINDAIVTRYTAETWRARAFAVRYVISFTGGSAAVWVVAASAGPGGFAQLFLTMSACAAVVLVAALAFPGGRPPPRG